MQVLKTKLAYLLIILTLSAKKINRFAQGFTIFLKIGLINKRRREFPAGVFVTYFYSAALFCTLSVGRFFWSLLSVLSDFLFVFPAVFSSGLFSETSGIWLSVGIFSFSGLLTPAAVFLSKTALSFALSGIFFD